MALDPVAGVLDSAIKSGLEHLARLGTDTSQPRAVTLLTLGRLFRVAGGTDPEAHFLAALDLSEALDDRALARSASIELGSWFVSQGELAQGRAHLSRALDAATKARDALAAPHRAIANAELALALALGGDAAASRSALQCALAEAGSIDAVRARVELRRGEVARHQNDGPTARMALERALEAARGLSPVESALIEVSIARARGEGAGDRPDPDELARLDARDLVALATANMILAGCDPAKRARLVAEAAVAITGSLGAELLVARHSLATVGTNGPHVVLVTWGDRSLVLAATTPPGARERTLARALLAHAGAGSTGTPASRVLAMLERVLASGLELERLVPMATDLAIEATGAARGLILLREPGTRLGFRVALGEPRPHVSRSLVREAFLSGRALHLADAASDPELAKASSVGPAGLRSVLVAPIPGEDGRTQGVLYLDDPGTVGRFGNVERDVAVAFAAQLGAPLRSVLARERERAAAASARHALSRPGRRPTTRQEFPEIVGSSRAIGRVLELVDRALDSTAPVLVSGESGTGKELVARALHVHGPRARGPFQALSCAALADGVLESELFGHAAGAFTGATAARRGVFEQAHGGTLFLDELQEASPKMQADLLRVIETGEVRAVGAEAVREVDVRLVAATNADLRALVSAGSFREDLYYRVNVIHVVLPPLRERPDDIPELVNLFLERAGCAGRELAPGILDRLLADAWPGNVRALKNCLDRALALAGPDGPIRAEHVVLEAPEKVSPARAVDLWAATPSIELNGRQLGLIDRLRAEGEISNVRYAEQEGISQPTGWRDLSDLLAKGILVKLGRGKGTFYRLSPSWEARVSGG